MNYQVKIRDIVNQEVDFYRSINGFVLICKAFSVIILDRKAPFK
jgi:hypothetical protein